LEISVFDLLGDLVGGTGGVVHELLAGEPTEAEEGRDNVRHFLGVPWDGLSRGDEMVRGEAWEHNRLLEVVQIVFVFGFCVEMSLASLGFTLVVLFVQLQLLSLESVFCFFGPRQVLGDGDSGQGLDLVVVALTSFEEGSVLAGVVPLVDLELFSLSSSKYFFLFMLTHATDIDYLLVEVGDGDIHSWGSCSHLGEFANQTVSVFYVV